MKVIIRTLLASIALTLMWTPNTAAAVPTVQDVAGAAVATAGNSGSGLCIASRSCPPYSRCYFKLENCPQSASKKKSRTREQLERKMTGLGYKQVGTFFLNEHIVIFQNQHDIPSTPVKYCLVLSDTLRTDCESKRYEISCSDRPYLTMTLPYKKNLLKNYMADEGLKELASLQRGKLLLSE